MMKQGLLDRKYIFIGNRYYVIKKMIDNNLNIVKIYATKDSFLSKYLDDNGIIYTAIESKSQLFEDLLELDYDAIVSNGCPYILPITKINNHLKSYFGHDGEYINVHPSLLPDCKGKHPVNAAILFNRKHGVTCHHMDDGIDTGNVIEQIEIPISEDISLDMLYKLSFMAEGDVFEMALNNGFQEKKNVVADNEYIYYSRKEEDMYILENDTPDEILTKVKAFSAKGMFAKIAVEDKILCVKKAKIITNSYVINKYGNRNNKSICLAYADCILVKLCDNLFEFTLENYQDVVFEQIEECDVKFLS